MRARTRWRILLFGVIVLCSTLAVFLLLPFAKEGTSWGDIPFFVSVLVGSVALGVLWWIASGFSARKSVLGWLVLIVPVVLHGLALADLLFERFNGERMARKVVVTSYAEEPIEWPGFDGPVGMKLTLEVSHPKGMKALIHPPEIRFGPQVEIDYDEMYSALTVGSGYFRGTNLETKPVKHALLKAVLLQKVFENPAPLGQTNLWNASARFDVSGKSKLTYFVLPGVVEFLPGTDRICVNPRIDDVPMCAKDVKPETGCASPNRTRLGAPVYSNGDDLTALWIASPGMNISHALTKALRAKSMLQGNPVDWAAMQKRLEPGGLAAAGYSLCEPSKDSHTAFRLCYCKAQSG